MKSTTLIRTVLFVLLLGTLLLSVSIAREHVERDFLLSLFDADYVRTLEQYQQQYTPADLIALKIQGRLPILPIKPKLAEPISGEAVLEEAPLETALEAPLSEQEHPFADDLLAEEFADQPLETTIA